MNPKLEEVFKLSGVPTFTFVRPMEYTKLLVSLRTPGRSLIVEGPSGIGKTTSVKQALEELNLQQSVTLLNARRQADQEVLSILPEISDAGIVIIDDFHRLDDINKQRIADFAKVLADEESVGTKLIFVGINRAGETLVKFAKDLTNRVDTIRFEANPPEKINELISKGENALNIEISAREPIVFESQGSFYIAQMLCRTACILREMTERQEENRLIDIGIEAIKLSVLEDVSTQFKDTVIQFVRGPKFRPSGRGAYIFLLNWLAEAGEWAIHPKRLLAQYPDQRPSVGQIVDKGFLEKFLAQNEEFGNLLHYDPISGLLGAEDPRFIFYLRNLNWGTLTKDAGFLNVSIANKYDFAISFAGADRMIAETISNRLAESQLSVFYDKDEQSSILAENVEEYLAPIYQSQARFVIALLSKDYPQRIWTKFESDQFKSRLGNGSVIPIRFSDSPDNFFSETSIIGSIFIDRDKEIGEQIDKAVDLLIEKIEQTRLD